jgi:hypothetical protein
MLNRIRLVLEFPEVTQFGLIEKKFTSRKNGLTKKS